MTARHIWTSARISAPAIVLVFVATLLMNGMFSTKASPTFQINKFSLAQSIDPNRFGYVTTGNLLKVIDLTTNFVVATIPVGNRPLNVVLSPDRSRAYVSNFGSFDVSVVSTSTNSVIATIPVGAFPAGLAVAPNGNEVYVPNSGASSISVISASTNSVIATIPVPESPLVIAFTPDGTRAYVTHYTSKTISVIDTSTRTIVATITGFPNHLTSIAMLPDGTRAYVVNDLCCISVISTATNTIIKSFGVKDVPGRVTISPDGTRAYLTYVVPGGPVSVFDTATDLPVAEYPIGAYPFEAQATLDGSRVYVVSSGLGYVFVVDTATGNVVDSINVGPGGDGGGPFAIALSPKTTTPVNQPPACTTPSFGPPSNMATGQGPVSIAAADFNNDGKFDMAVINQGANTVSIFSGDGAGGFTNAGDFATPSTPNSVEAGDFNNDGKLDLAIPCYFGLSCAVLLGDGAGGFTTTATLPIPGGARYAALGDFNRDGKLDVAVTDQGKNNIRLFFGDGAGGFSPATILTVGVAPFGVRATDLNGDGKLDLVVANFNSCNVSILLGDGAGGFAPPISFPTGCTPVNLAIADFNGDGKLDVVVGNELSNGISVLLGNGLGGFGAPTFFATGDHATSVAAADFNGDNKPDIAVQVRFGNPSVAVLLGDGTGNFSAPAYFPLGNGPFALAAADLNRDGKPDIAVAAPESQKVFILLNTCSAADTTPPTIACPANVVAPNAANQCSANVNTGAATATDNIDGAITPIGARSDGQVFTAPYPVGTTTITWTATDSAGNSATCQQTITVNDTQPPIITAPPAKVLSTSTSSLFISDATLGAATTSDNCSGAVAVNRNGVPSGNLFPIGKTIVRYTATDAAGNIATASQVVIVYQSGPGICTYAYVTTVNKNNISVVDTATNAVVVSSIPVGPEPNGIVFSSDGNRAYVANSVGDTVQGNVSVINLTTNTVISAIPVGLTPQSIAITPNGACLYVPNDKDGTVSVISTATNTVLTSISLGDCLTGVDITPDGRFAYVVGFCFNTIYVIDTATNTLAHTIPVGGGSPLQIRFAPDGARAYVSRHDGNDLLVIDSASNNVIGTIPVGLRPFYFAISPDGTRAYVPNALSNTVSVVGLATNTVIGNPIPVGTYPVGVAFTPDGTRVYVTNQDSVDVSVIDLSTNTVIATIAHGSGPGSNYAVGVIARSCSDTQPPMITCPANITENNSAGQCTANVNPGSATATDNFDGSVTPVGTRSDGQALSAAYPVGTTAITWTATDHAGNSASCQQTVTVNDTQPPAITCPANINRNTDAGLCSAVVNYAASASDNCSSVNIGCNPPSGSAFQKGTTTVNCTATDTAGNSSACSFTMTVVDNQAPQINCPANITVNTDAGVCSAVVTYSAPSVSDNCSGGAPVCSPPSSSTFPVGTTTVSCTATDSANLTSSCSFTITVNAPQLTALGPAKVWIGLKNSDDVGTKFDLLAEVLRNGSVIGSGQLNAVPGGSSGFNNAILDTINLALSSQANLCAGDTLGLRLSVRIAASSGHRSGTARLWYDDAAATSRFNATISGMPSDYFLANAFSLGTSAGPGPKKTIDVFVDRAAGGNPFKPFGTWTKSF